MKFIVDANVGKLAKWLRMMGHDAVFFEGKDDAEMVAQARAEKRVILTRDTHLMEWGAIRSGRIKAVLLKSDEVTAQTRQVITELRLESPRPFTVCLECNLPLEHVDRASVENDVPPYVFRTQSEFMRCPKCRRIYWRGTHWQAMTEKMSALANGVNSEIDGASGHSCRRLSPGA